MPRPSVPQAEVDAAIRSLADIKPSPLDAETLDRMREETAAMLAAKPEAFSEIETERASKIAAREYREPLARDEGDPEDVSHLLEQAFRAIGRRVPDELLAASRAKQEPIVQVGTVPGELSQEDEVERQRRIQRKFVQAISGGSPKRQAYLAALSKSPTIAFFNRKDRWMTINGVDITVPEGMVNIPAIVAQEIEWADAHAHWAERERKRAQAFLNMDRPSGSFVEKKAQRFSIS